MDGREPLVSGPAENGVAPVPAGSSPEADHACQPARRPHRPARSRCHADASTRRLHRRLAHLDGRSVRRADLASSRRAAHQHDRAGSTRFRLGTREVISWKSQDGTTIEGVLIKPADFDAGEEVSAAVHHSRRADRHRSADAVPDTRYYPSDIWAARGALVLKVNYRGSAGYGEKFRQLNVRNLGVGDAWDVLSGVDYLVGKGLGRSGEGRLHGLEPGRLHLGVSDHVVRSLRGDFGRRRHFELGDLLLQHRHHAVHDPVPRARTRPRTRRSTRRLRR